MSADASNAICTTAPSSTWSPWQCMRRAAEASVPAELAELKRQLSRISSGLAEVSLELHEISRGVPPAILANGGLRTAIKELARRSPVPARLDVAIRGRLPEPIQVATYYLVAEALTNTAKHAHASTVHVQLNADDTDTGDPVLRVLVLDEGRGGAPTPTVDPAGRTHGAGRSPRRAPVGPQPTRHGDHPVRRTPTTPGPSAAVAVWLPTRFPCPTHAD
jgi:signal transduction histidine kinase